jgi:hypothetical protein
MHFDQLFDYCQRVVFRVVFLVTTQSVRARQGRASRSLLTVKETSAEFIIILSVINTAVIIVNGCLYLLLI